MPPNCDAPGSRRARGGVEGTLPSPSASLGHPKVSTAPPRRQASAAKRPVPRGVVRDRRHARQLEAWVQKHRDDHRAADVVVELLIFDWPSEPTTRHLSLELAVAHWRGRALDPDEPVPGCDCEGCRRCVPSCPVCYAVWPTPAPERSARNNDRTSPVTLDVDAARAQSIVDVAHRLGVEPNRHGWAVCPFHEDAHPSLHLNGRKNAAFCNPCGKSWDGIALAGELLNLDFRAAVRWVLGIPDRGAA